MRRHNLDNLKISLAPLQKTKYNCKDILEHYIMYLVQGQNIFTVWFMLLKLLNSEILLVLASKTSLSFVPSATQASKKQF